MSGLDELSFLICCHDDLVVRASVSTVEVYEHSMPFVLAQSPNEQDRQTDSTRGNSLTIKTDSNFDLIKMAHSTEEAKRVIAEMANTNLDDFVRDKTFTIELEEVWSSILYTLHSGANRISQ